MFTKSVYDWFQKHLGDEEYKRLIKEPFETENNNDFYLYDGELDSNEIFNFFGRVIDPKDRLHISIEDIDTFHEEITFKLFYNRNPRCFEQEFCKLLSSNNIHKTYSIDNHNIGFFIKAIKKKRRGCNEFTICYQDFSWKNNTIRMKSCYFEDVERNFNKMLKVPVRSHPILIKRVKKYRQTLFLVLWKLREMFPKDIVQMIGKMIWKMRYKNVFLIE